MSSLTHACGLPERLPNLLGFGREQISGADPRLANPSFRAASLHRWIYQRREVDFARMTDLPARLRSDLTRNFRIAWPDVDRVAASTDGTHKYLLRLEDARRVESVYIPQASGRITLCLSSQVGCALGCTFCRTARMGFVRNLTPGEIVGQALRLEERHDLRPPYNIVFMGMGEPLLNLEAVLSAFRIFTDADGMGISARRITVSTAGYVPGIRALAREQPRPRLAVSLCATTDRARADLMPINRRYPLQELLGACRDFASRGRERVTFEYVVLEGVNDKETDVRRLVRLLSRMRSKVNLIPYNPIDDESFHRPRASALERMRRALVAGGVPASVRWSKGVDIGAACGQLWWQEQPHPPRQTSTADQPG